MGASREFATQYTEPTIIHDIFASGAAHAVAINGGCVRLTWYVEIPLFTADGTLEHRIVDRVVLPQEAIPNLMLMLGSALATGADGRLLSISRRVTKIGH